MNENATVAGNGNAHTRITLVSRFSLDSEVTHYSKASTLTTFMDGPQPLTRLDVQTRRRKAFQGHSILAFLFPVNRTYHSFSNDLDAIQ